MDDGRGIGADVKEGSRKVKIKKIMEEKRNEVEDEDTAQRDFEEVLKPGGLTLSHHQASNEPSSTSPETKHKVPLQARPKLKGT